MSIYEGRTIGEAEYAHGASEGATAADSLACGTYSLSDVWEADAREYLSTARSERTRAYWLGWLRGFRAGTR